MKIKFVDYVIGALALTIAGGLYAGETPAGELEKNVVRFGASAALAVAVTPLFEDSEHPTLYPVAAATVPSILKEVYDLRTVHGPQASDLAIGFAGATVGAIIAGEKPDVKASDIMGALTGVAAGGVAGAVVGGALQLADGTQEAKTGNVIASVVSAAVGGLPGLAIGLGWYWINGEEPAK